MHEREYALAYCQDTTHRIPSHLILELPPLALVRNYQHRRMDPETRLDDSRSFSLQFVGLPRGSRCGIPVCFDVRMHKRPEPHSIRSYLLGFPLALEGAIAPLAAEKEILKGVRRLIAGDRPLVL